MLLSLIERVMKNPYHTYLVVNYIFNILNWRFVYQPDKYPKLGNLLDMLERKLKVDPSLRSLLESSLNQALLRAFSADFLLQFGMIEVLVKHMDLEQRRLQKDKAKMFIDLFMLDGEVVLQRILTQILKVSRH